MIFSADMLVAFSHAEGMIKQTLAHPVSLPNPIKRTNLPDEPHLNCGFILNCPAFPAKIRFRLYR